MASSAQRRSRSWSGGSPHKDLIRNLQNMRFWEYQAVEVGIPTFYSYRIANQYGGLISMPTSLKSKALKPLDSALRSLWPLWLWGPASKFGALGFRVALDMC